MFTCTGHVHALPYIRNPEWSCCCAPSSPTANNNPGMQFPGLIASWGSHLENCKCSFRSVPSGECAQGPPSPHAQPAFCLAQMPAPSVTLAARPSPSWLAPGLGLAGCGCSIPLPYPALPTPAPAPSLRWVSGERRSWAGAPRPCLRKGLGSVTRGHPGWLGPFISALPGRREEEIGGGPEIWRHLSGVL